MTLMDELTNLVGETLTDAQAAARRLIGMRLPPQVAWLGLALVIVLAVLVINLAFITLQWATGGTAPVGNGVLHPVWAAVVQCLSILFMTTAMSWVGRLFGGRGRFVDALLLMVWLQFMLLIAAALQLLSAFAIPLLATAIQLLGLVLFAWLLVNFTAVLHGFRNRFLVFLGLIGGLIALAIVIQIVAGFFGIDPLMFAVY